MTPSLRRPSADRRPRTGAVHGPQVAALVERLEERAMLTVYVVNSTDDAAVGSSTTANGQLTLREAVVAAGTNTQVGDAPAGEGGGVFDEILFDLPGTAASPPRIVLNAGELDIFDRLVIEGRTFGGLNVQIVPSGSRAFDVSGGTTVGLRNLDVSGGTAPGAGALLVRGGSAVGMTGVRMFGNAATAFSGVGGAIRVQEGSLLVAEGSNQFMSNRAGGDGGAVSVGANSTAQFLANAGGRTEFFGNTADSGGAVHVDGGAFVAAGVNFAGNLATLSGGLGGAIYNAGGGVAVFDSTLVDNRADNGFGGAITSDFGVLEIQRSTFATNSAGRNGGAVRLFRGVLVTGDTVFVNNSAGGDGGAVDAENATVAGGGTVFLDNAARRDGGGFHSSGGSLTGEGFTFGDGQNPGNSAGRNGGGLAVFSGIGLLRGSLFLGNAALEDGGGLYAINSSSGPAPRLEVIDSVFANNGSVNAGGGVDLENSLATFTRVTVAGNRSPTGGGFSIVNGQTVLVDVTVDGNAAEFRGGGLFAGGSAVIASLRSVYVNNGGPGDLRPTTGRLRVEGITVPSDQTLAARGINVAGLFADSGGGIHFEGNVLTLQGGLVAGNVADAFPNLFVDSAAQFNPVGVQIG